MSYLTTLLLLCSSVFSFGMSYSSYLGKIQDNNLLMSEVLNLKNQIHILEEKNVELTHHIIALNSHINENFITLKKSVNSNNILETPTIIFDPLTIKLIIVTVVVVTSMVAISLLFSNSSGSVAIIENIPDLLHAQAEVTAQTGHIVTEEVLNVLNPKLDLMLAQTSVILTTIDRTTELNNTVVHTVDEVIESTLGGFLG